MGSSLAWSWLAMAATMALIGAVLTAWALLSDRARGRKRCPKCWYDMSATVGLICPECRHDAERSSRLEKTRRRWVIAGIGMVVALGSLYPALRSFQMRNGLWPLSPTEVLIQRFNSTGWPRYRDSAAAEELFSRLAGSGVSDAQRRRVYDTLLPSAIQTRNRWPVTLPMRVRLAPSFMFGRNTDTLFCISATSPRGLRIDKRIVSSRTLVNYLPVFRDSTRELVAIDSTTTSIDVHAESRDATTDQLLEWSGSHTIRVTPVATIDDAIIPVRDAGVDATVQSAMQIHLYDRGPERRDLQVSFGGSEMLAPPGLQDLAFGLRIEFRSGSEVIATCRCFFSEEPFGNPATSWVRLEGDLDQLFDPNAPTGQWSVVVSGDGEMALRQFDREKYWAGSFTLPFSKVQRYLLNQGTARSVP